MDSVYETSPSTRGQTTGEVPLPKAETAAIAGVLAKFSVMGKVTATGELLLLDKDAVDGSENPYGVLLETVDTTSEAKPCTVWIRGSFESATLVFAVGTVVADVWDALRALQIYAFDVEDMGNH